MDFYEGNFKIDKDNTIRVIWNKIDSIHSELHKIGHVVIDKIKFGNKMKL